MPTRWKLKEFLDKHQITVYELAKHTSGRLSRNALYKLANEAPAQLRISTIDTLIPALERMTGQRVELNDLLEYER